MCILLGTPVLKVCLVHWWNPTHYPLVTMGQVSRERPAHWARDMSLYHYPLFC